MVDIKLITNLESEIEFLKSEISTKNGIIQIRNVVGKHGALNVTSQRAVQVTQKTL